MTKNNLSSFEQLFNEWPTGQSIKSTRQDRFDGNHGLFYAPLKYVTAPIPKPPTKTPAFSWIRGAFADFVRDEFSSTQDKYDHKKIEVAQRNADLYSISASLRDQTEQQLVYGGTLEDIISSIEGFDTVSRVFAIMCSDSFGNTANSHNVSLEQFRSYMTNMKVGCRIVLPGLPFRDQNLLRVDNNPSAVTLAESIFLIRLHCTALAIYQVLPTGADVVVLSDGTLYAPILGVEESEAELYLDNVRRLRDHLNLRGTVSIIELKKLVEIYDGGTGDFQECCDDIFTTLIDFKKHPGADTEFMLQYNSLARGMRWNYNTRKFGSSLQDTAKWVQYGENCFDGKCSPLPDSNFIDEVSARYAAVNLALRWHNVITAVLPTAMRGTMHPKPGQVALPKLGSCFPWNGIAVTESGGGSKLLVEVHSLAEANRRDLDLVAHATNSGNIIFYQRRKGK